MSKSLTTVLVLAVATAGHGCSATRLTYNHADWLLKRELIKHTCPTEAQQKWLTGQLDALHTWHRRKELPRYVRALRRLAGALDRPLARPALEAFFGEMDGARRRFSARLAHPAGTYLEGLAAPQIRCVVIQMHKRGTKTLKTVGLPRRRYVEEQREKLEDRLEDFMGDLTRTQRSAVDRLLAGRQKTHRQMATAWHNWGRRLVALLRDRRDRATRTRRINAALGGRHVLHSAAERKVISRWEKSNRDLTWAVARLMTASQRGRLKKSLQKLAGDLEWLARQPGPLRGQGTLRGR